MSITQTNVFICSFGKCGKTMMQTNRFSPCFPRFTLIANVMFLHREQILSKCMTKMLIYGGIKNEANVEYMWYLLRIYAQIQRKQISAFTLSLPPEHISVKFRTLNLHHIYFSCKAVQIYFFVQWMKFVFILLWTLVSHYDINIISTTIAYS